MESLSFFIKQFFVSFLAGCIVNFYAIICYFVLKNADILPGFFNNMQFLEKIPEKVNLTFVFIITAMLIGIIIEGFGEVCFEKYYSKSKNNCRKKRTIREYCLYLFAVKPTIFWVCKNYSENQENPLIRKIRVQTMDMAFAYFATRGCPSCLLHQKLQRIFLNNPII